jgi:hypothetical protein
MIDGIPPGTWNVDVTCIRAMSEEGRMSMAEPAGTVIVRDGETTDLSIDLSAMVPGTLDGQVVCDGAPVAKSRFLLVGAVSQQVTTDGEGRFHATLRPGQYSLRRAESPLRARERAVVVRDQDTAQTFQFVAAKLRLRVLDADGQPVSGVTISLRDADTERWSLPATGADGGTELEVEAETFTAFVLPKRLHTPEAQQEVWRNNPGNQDPFATLRIRLGPVTAADDGKPIDLRLPAEW